MKTISKVKNVQGNGSFENQYGAEQPDGNKLLFKFDYEFEDGISMMANHKTNISPFPVGTEVEYEVTRESEQFGKSGKVSKPSDFPPPPKKDDYIKGIEIGHAINNAVNLLCSGTELDVQDKTGTIEEKIYLYSKKIMLISERLKNE